MSLPGGKEKEPKKRSRHYMQWGEPDGEDTEVAVPKRTLQRMQQSHLHDDEKSCITKHPRQMPFPSSQSHYQDSNVDDISLEEDSLKTQADLMDDSTDDEDVCSMASTVPITCSERGDSMYMLPSSSDDEGEPEVLEEQYFIPDNEQEEGDCEENFITDDNTLETLPLEAVSVESNEIVASGTKRPAFYSTLKALNKLPSTVTSNICLSPKEILFNILSLTEAHEVNSSLFVGICKLVNSMFSDPILPDTQFKLDQLILSACGMKYHYYCSKLNCQRLLTPTEKFKSITCKCGTVNDTSDVNTASFFVTFDISTQLEILFKDKNLCSLLRDPKVYKKIGSGMHDLWDGKLYQNFIRSLDPQDLATVLSMIFCLDGSPLFKPSCTEIYPLLATINKLPAKERLKNTVLLGLWFGKGKPNLVTFFKPVRRSIVSLSNNGTTISMGGQKTFVKVKVLGCCVDAALRGPIQGIHLHNGECGCNWCQQVGEIEGSGSTARKYPYLQIPAEPRTHEEVVRDGQAVKKLPKCAPSAPKPHVNGVIGKSPLLKFPGFNIVDGIILDSMHNFFLGTTRQFSKLWLGLEGKLILPDKSLPGYYIGSPGTLEKIDKRIAALVVPEEFRRLPRPLSDLVHMKSRELENFALYILVVVLKGIVAEKYLRHFTLYVEGIYLLLKDVVLPEDLESSDILLKTFVDGIYKLYRNPNFSRFKQYTYNVHISLHAAQNSENWRPAWAASGYCYENGIGILQDYVYANNGIADQVNRSLCKHNIRDILSQEIKSARCASFANSISGRSAYVVLIGNVKVFGISKDLHPNDEEEYLLTQSSLEAEDFCEAKKIIFNDCVYGPRLSSKRTRNDFVQLTDERIVQLKKVIVSEKLEVVLFFCSVVHVTPAPIHLLPLLPISSPYMYHVDLIEQELFEIPHTNLSKICFYSDLTNLGGDKTVSVMANIMNRV